jgi:hypothetical protein
VARLRRLTERLALRLETHLKFRGDGEVAGERFGRIHESPLLAIGRFATALIRSKRAPRALACIERSPSLSDAPARAIALTRSGNILHQHFPHVVSLARKHRLGGADHRPPVRRTARRAWVAAAITPAAPVSGGRVSSFRDAWKNGVHDCSCFRPNFEYQTATTLLCAAIVSFRSLIPRFITAIRREQLTEIHAGVTHRLNCSKMFVFRRAPARGCRRVSSSADDSDADVLLGRKPSLLVAQVYDRSPSHLRCSRSRSAMSGVRRLCGKTRFFASITI